MMRLENLLQFLVPLGFLAIWALTSLFNREAQPLPPRTTRPPGPRPGGGPPPMRPVERRPVEPAAREKPSWANPPSGLERPAATRPQRRPDDDILIIEPETARRAGAPDARTASANTGKRAARARTAPVVPAKRPEPTTPRALTASMKHEAPPKVARGLSLDPLSTQQTHLTPDAASAAKTESAKTPETPMLGSADLKLLLKTPAQIRQSIVLNEILQPPVALRRTRGPIPRIGG